MTIVQKGNPVLRQNAKEVPVEDITGSEIKGVIKRMKAALDGTQYGVAIAAPQIGESVRIFVVKGEIFLRKSRAEIEAMDPKDIPPDRTFINPVIIRASSKKEPVDEGCLSVDGYWGIVERPHKTRIRFYNEQGEELEYGASGLLSQIFQHEIDHLDGILFVDKAKDVRLIEELKDHEEK